MKKKRNSGYKGMLRDRVPKTVDLALKWCKVKKEWVDHVYYNFIWFCEEKQLREAQARALLGLDRYANSFSFLVTINWDNLDPEEKAHWEWVCEWVKWFENNWLNVVNTYEICVKTLKSEEQTKIEIKKHFSNLDSEWQEKLANYIIKNIQYEYLCIFQTLI